MTTEYYHKFVEPTLIDDSHKGKRLLDLRGRRFYRLVVIGRAPEYNSGNSPKWYCKCDCGNPDLVLADTDELREGKRRSCGCMNLPTYKEPPSEVTTAFATVSIGTNIKKPMRSEFKTWKAMYPWEKRRIYEPGIKKNIPIPVFETWYDMLPGQVARYYKKGYTSAEITYIATHHDAEAKKDENGVLRDKDGFVCLIKKTVESLY